MNKFWMLGFCLLLLGSVQAQPSVRPSFPYERIVGEGRMVVGKDGRYALADSSRRLLTPLLYDDLLPLPGMQIYAVRQGNVWGAVGQTGELLVPLAYEQVRAGEQQTLEVRLQGKAGLFNIQGKMLWPVVSDQPFFYFPGGTVWACERDRWWAIDVLQGRRKPLPYEQVYDRMGPVVRVQQDTTMQLVDSLQRPLLPPRFHEARPYNARLLLVQRDRKWGFYVPQGDSLVGGLPFDEIYCLYAQPPVRPSANPWADLYASKPSSGLRDHGQLGKVRIGEYWGMVDGNGKLLTAVRFDEIGLQDATAPQWFRQGKYYGVMDAQGRQLLPAAYGGISWDVASRLLLLEQDSRMGWADAQGKIWQDPSYERVVPAHGNLLVCQQGRWGLCDSKGQQLLPPVLSQLYAWEDWLIGVAEDKQLHVYTPKGQLLLRGDYEGIERLPQTSLLLLHQGGRYGLVDSKGKMLLPLLYEHIRYKRAGIVEVSEQGHIKELPL